MREGSSNDCLSSLRYGVILRSGNCRAANGFLSSLLISCFFFISRSLPSSIGRTTNVYLGACCYGVTVDTVKASYGNSD